MSLTPFGCYAWWFVLGSLAGWLALWLVDRLFLRDGRSAERLRSAEDELAGALDLQSKQASDIVALRSELSATGKTASEVPQLRQRIADQESREKAHQAEVQRLTGELDSRTQTLNQGATEINRLSAELAAASTRVGELSSALGTARDASGVTQGHLDAANGELTRLRTASEALETNLANTKDELARVRSEFQRQGERMTLLERDLDGARQSIIDAKRAGGNLDATQEEALAQEVTRLRQELEAVRTGSVGLVQEIERFKSASTSDAARITGLTNDLEALRLSSHRQGEELGETRRALTEAEARGAKTSYDSSALIQQKDAELATLKTSLADATGRADKFGAEVARLMAQSAEQSAVAGELARVKAELADRTTAIAGLAGDLSELESLRTRVTTLSAQVGQFETLRNAMEAARRAAAGHAAEIARLNDQLLAGIPGVGTTDPSGDKS